jgi:hypothetical protein
VDTIPDIFQRIIELTFAKDLNRKTTKIAIRLESGEEFSIEIPSDLSPHDLRGEIERKVKEQHGASSKGKEGPPS